MTANFDDRSWAKAWDSRYGGTAEEVHAGRAPGRGRGRMPAARLPYLFGSWLLLALVAVPAAFVAGGSGAPAVTADLAGNARGEAVEIQVRNRSRGETGLITASDDYSLRLSNTEEGGGGGAVYGCRAPAAPPDDNLACLYADNLRAGKAFLFRTRQGGPAGHIEVGDANQAPFTTNGRGMVENLNAERVGGLTAQQLLGQQTPGDPQPGGQGPAGPQGDTGPRGPSDGFAAQANSVNNIGGNTLVLALPVPAGSFIVSADLQIDNDDAASTTVNCDLRAAGTPIDDVDSVTVAADLDTNDDESISLNGAATIDPASTIDVVCSTGGGNLDVHDIDITAIQVASLTGP